MLLSSLAIRRPVLAVVVNLLLLVLGIGALMSMSVRQYPDVDQPQIAISTTYFGASSVVVENTITKRIEEAVAGIEGITLVRSTSFDEISQVNLEFSLARDIDFAAADVRDQIARVRRLLPEEAEDPVVEKTSTDARPVMWITMGSEERDRLALTDFARRNLVDSLSVVPGVARVFIGGEQRYAMRIWLRTEQLALYDLTAADVANRLRTENIEIPAGRIESQDREWVIRAATRFPDEAAFASMVVAVRNDAQITLGQVARIELGSENYRSNLSFEGTPGIGLGIVRQSTSNLIEMIDGVRARLDQIKVGLPADIQLQVAYDESVFVRASLAEVINTLIIAAVLVVLVILVFLQNLRATLVPMIAIPVSIVATFLVMGALGYSINVLTLLALVLAIGIVVDDAIVVMENAFRRIELGEPRLLAADRGTREVGFAIIATTLVLVAVFVPVAFMPGSTGRLFREFGITMAAAVCFSSFVALTASAMLCSRVLPQKVEAGRLARAIGRVIDYPTTVYGRLLPHLVRGRWVVVAGAVAVAAFGIALMMRTPEELAPPEDRGVAYAIVSTPEGATISYTTEQVQAIENILTPYLDEDGPLDRIIAIVPSFGGGRTANSAFMVLRLKEWAARDLSVHAFIGEVLPRVLGLPGARAFIVSPGGFGARGAGQAVSYAIGGDDYAQVQGWAAAMVAKARQHPSMVNVRDDTDLTKPQLELVLDRRRAAELGVSAQDVADALQILLGSARVTKFDRQGEQYEVILQAEDSARASPSDLTGIFVRAQAGGLVPLVEVVNAREVGVAKSLPRIDRRSAVTITATPAPGYTIGQSLDALDVIARDVLPAEATVTYLDQSRDFRESSAGMYITFGLALVVVFLVLAAQFESWIHPLIILLTVPLGLIGVFGSLQIAGMSNNLYAQIGMVMLVGLMAKNGILMIEFANQLRDRGREVIPAIIEASKLRLRPILMTSISTIAGAVPLMLAGGAGAEGRQVIGTVVAGGFGVATVLILLVIPAFYAILAPYARPAGTIARRLDALDRDHPRAE